MSAIDLEVDDELAWAVLWEFVRTAGDGEPVVAAPVQIPARWLWQSTVSSGPDTATVALAGRVLVDREISLDSIMWEGKLSEWNALTPPQREDWLVQVKTTSTVEDIKGDAVRRKVGVQFFRGRLPQVEA